SITFVSLARATGRAICRRQPEYAQNTLIVGLGELSQGLAERIARHPEYGLNVIGFVAADESREGFVLGRVLGSVQDLPQLVSTFDVERVVVASDSHGDADFIRDLNDTGVQVDVVPRFHEVISGDIDIHMVEGIPVIGVRGFDLSRSSALMKRGMDIIGSFAGLIIVAPVFAVVALAIKLDSAGPIFFRQVRAGARGQQFHILKFRTMRPDAEEHKGGLAHLSKHSADSDRTMFKIPDDPRITRLGKLLRRSSIDELPQLWNVFRGEMSLVGPRPLILEEHAQVRDWETKRLGLRPGMTGLWQVLGRDEIPFVEMVRLDYVYVTSWSLGGDLRLLLRTLPVLIRGV
ncbi:MAG TPA: sugar transferase, partial [Gaiellaceae bacterium]